MFKSWRTTTVGLIGLLIVAGPAIQAAVDGDPTTVPDWHAAMAALSAFGVALFARDNKVTSAQAGAEPPKSV